MRKARGVGLGTVLVVVALVVTLGFALAGASVQHLGLQTRLTNGSRALDMARAAVNLGLERVLTDPDYGKDPTADTLQEYSDGQGAVGRMTFNPNQASANHIPYSLNNLSGTEVKAGSTGQVVPLKTVHLIGVGTFRNVTRQVEVVLSLPPYPYAAASDGPISARDVIVGAAPPGSLAGIPTGKLKPASLLSNAEGKQALVLGEGSNVSGDLMARGGIKVDQGATVKGLVRPNQQERELPIWHTDDYDPIVQNRPYIELDESYSAGSQNTLGTSTGSEPVKFTGTARRDGNLNIEGDLDIQGALVFVDGDLNVNGALTGKGVVVCTGNLTVRDHAEVDSHDKVALLTQGKMTLKGGGLSSSLITGILYSEGGFEASQLTLRGVVISRQGSSGDRPVTLNGTRVVRDPEAVTVTVAPTTVGQTSFVVDLGGLGGPGGGFTPPQSPAVPPQGGPRMAPSPVPLEVPTDDPGRPVGQIGNTTSLLATFTVHPSLPENQYTVVFSPIDAVPPVNGQFTAADMAAQIEASTGVPASTVFALIEHSAAAAVVNTPPAVAPAYTLTVKEPSQLLPFYQQARIVLWKER